MWRFNFVWTHIVRLLNWFLFHFWRNILHQGGGLLGILITNKLEVMMTHRIGLIIIGLFGTYYWDYFNSWPKAYNTGEPTYQWQTKSHLGPNPLLDVNDTLYMLDPLPPLLGVFHNTHFYSPSLTLVTLDYDCSFCDPYLQSSLAGFSAFSLRPFFSYYRQPLLLMFLDCYSGPLFGHIFVASSLPCSIHCSGSIPL